MDPFKNMQDAWKRQSTSSLPEIESIKKNIKKIRTSLIRKNIAAIVSLAITILVMLALLFFIDFNFITTKLAVVGMIITISFAIIFMLKINNQLYKADKLQSSSKAYLKHLKTFNVNQKKDQRHFVVFYFLAITVFLYLYFYEVYLSSPTIGLIAYASATAWILFVWFYLQPKMIAKQNKEINKMIEELESIEIQLDNKN